ncbi:helix-turn-helix protein [Kribbella steppae]|uniref:Helix-turn-helix protein n=1 Tax=Kribbella steppae TaxID=2512223 RepID=A0A4R2H7A4_9ACTN|nr:pyridoxamine 5'-phosphate oxidase family protein [Kribbella steppae]TCO20325.1 helix-turn-helix protein [Kribbella steppae]
MNTTTPHQPAVDLATRVRQRRMALGLSRADTARRAGLSIEAIDQIESRPVAMTAGDLLRLVEALDTTVSDLVTEPPEQPSRGLSPVHPTLQGMPRPECLALLQTGGIGRIAYQAANQLMVVPVTFSLYDELIVFRTAQDAAIAQYALEPVAFEVDRIDEGMHQGWSVLVNGTVRPATDDEAAQVHDLVEPWAGGTRDTCMVIEPAQVSGRRVRAW